MSKGYNYQTITLDNKQYENGVTGGSITYSEIMCGDCLIPVKDCGCLG